MNGVKLIVAFTWLFLPLFAWGWPWGFVYFGGLILFLQIESRIKVKFLTRVLGFILSVIVVTVSTIALHQLMLVWFFFVGIQAWVVPDIYCLANIVMLLPTKEESDSESDITSSGG